MTSSQNSPLRLRRIEKDDLPLHTFLSEADECYYLYEYTSGRNFSHSPANDRINNLKKDVRYKGTAAWGYKDGAILQCANEFKQTLNPKFLAGATIVPVPPSKAKSDPAYDDRMIRTGQAMSGNVRELVTQTASRQAAHASQPGERTSIDELKKLYVVDEALSQPEPGLVVILDDVLTTGRHYVAMRDVLRARFLAARIVGLFVARRVFPTEGDLSDFI